MEGGNAQNWALEPNEEKNNALTYSMLVNLFAQHLEKEKTGNILGMRGDIVFLRVGDSWKISDHEI
jgi:hypothetical protein